MNARYAFWAKGLLLVSGTGLLINGAVTLMAQTDSVQAARTPVKTATAGTGQTASETESLSPVQKALRERYRRAGLQMPPMTLSALPKTADSAKQAARNRNLQKPGVASRSGAPSQAVGRSTAHPGSATKTPGFLSRILPARARIHWPSRPKFRWPSRLTNWNRRRRETRRAVRRTAPQPSPAAAKAIVQKRQQPRQLPGALNQSKTKQGAVTAASPLAPQPIAKRQPKKNEPKAVPSVAAKELTKPKTSADDGLTNPFTEMSETEADRKAQSPFTGLKLKDAPTTDKQAPVVAQKPQHVDHAAPPLPDSADVASTPAQKARSVKLHRIAERSEQAGLKGFCPVVLRDQRDLVDAKTKFTATYKSKTYHFSSAIAKAAFEKHPQKYAPAGAGLDVVRLANRGDRVDGSLDYAVWFQDRLYLFSTADSLRTFTITPADYAVTDNR